LVPSLVPLLRDSELKVQVKTVEMLGQLGRRKRRRIFCRF
jgi:hypothetical protein